jgi:outer membrane protein OmpA-like peptidoglycan-associated protein
LNRILRTFSGFAVVAVVGVATAQATEPEAAVYPGYSKTLADVQALESYHLVALRRVHFAAGKHDLSLREKASLENFATPFCQTNQWVVELRGYADGARSTEQNANLSAERAKAVARILSEYGIPSQNILPLGLGEIDPGSPAPKPEHQRVDIRIFMRPANETSPESLTTLVAPHTGMDATER